MLNDRLQAAQIVAAKLFAAEAALDQALASVAELTAAMPRARMSAKISAVVGQDAIEDAADAQASLIEARRKLVAAHGKLEQVRVEVGLRVFAAGGGYIKPPSANRDQEPESVQQIKAA